MPIIDKTKNPQSFEQTDSILSQIQAHIANQVRLGRKFTIKDVSDELNLSEYNMNKILIKGTGQTLKSFIGNCRRAFYENKMHQPESMLAASQKVGICLTARKTGVDLLQLSAKRIRLQ